MRSARLGRSARSSYIRHRRKPRLLSTTTTPCFSTVQTRRLRARVTRAALAMSVFHQPSKTRAAPRRPSSTCWCASQSWHPGSRAPGHTFAFPGSPLAETAWAECRSRRSVTGAWRHRSTNSSEVMFFCWRVVCNGSCATSDGHSTTWDQTKILWRSLFWCLLELNSIQQTYLFALCTAASSTIFFRIKCGLSHLLPDLGLKWPISFTSGRGTARLLIFLWLT